MPPVTQYDYVIVGGGSAGCVLASRLSEDPAVEVLLIERGARYKRLALGIPLLGKKFMASHLRTYETCEQVNCHSRRIRQPVASTMGGGSSVNAMMYVRGERRAYDRWVEQGACGWGFDDILPYFRRMEDFEGGESRYHGVGGPVGVCGSRYKSRFGQAFIDACVEMGLRRNDDFTGAEQLGAGFYQYTQSDGERSSTALGYLKPAEPRRNLKVRSKTEAQRIILDGQRAVGVVCRRSDGEFSAHASREVILCAGAFGTPRLMLLSGIGPADELHAIGIEPRCDLPGVGKGLQDHPRLPILYEPAEPVSLTVAALAVPFLQWCWSRQGIFTSPMIAAGAFMKLSEASELADCQFSVQWAGSPPFRAAVDLQVCLIDVESRGSIRLASADPRHDPIIDPNYLATPREVGVMVEAVRFARALTRTRALREFGLKRELAPGPAVQSDGELASYVKQTIETAFHPAGTCAMGENPQAVVDSRLSVHGLDGLRIADASVMPSLVNGNTNAPTIMIAEKAADLILGLRA